MAIPTGVQKVTLTFGPYFDPAGRRIADEVLTIDCAAAPIRTGDGGVVVKERVRVRLGADGTATKDLVATDATGLSKSGFTYTVSGPESILPNALEVSLPASVPVVDFDALSPAPASDGTVVYYPIDALMPSIATQILTSGSAIAQALSVTTVIVRNRDGSLVSGGVVVLTLTSDGLDIDNIARYDSLEEVGA